MSGSRDGAWPPALLTVPLSLLFGAGSSLYHKLWEMRNPVKADVPVISVGNLTVGGNGKTPFVIALVKILMESDSSLREQNAIAVLSRGYGRKERKQVEVEPDSDWREAGDEPILIKRACPSALVISDGERSSAARVAVEEFGSRVMLLDDGFQHRALARDIDIVLLDAERPLGNGWRLPAGPLRESAGALRRSDVIVSVGNGNAAAELARSIGKPVIQASPRVDLAQMSPSPLEKRCFLLTGVARPERVAKMLERLGVDLVGHRAYGDHAGFSESALAEVERTARQARADLILTTEKDAIRVGGWTCAIPVVPVPYRIEIVNEEALMKAVTSAVEGRMKCR